jgi:osmotically-inducible protein OsmY
MVDFKSDLSKQIAKKLADDERTMDSAIEVMDDGGVITLSGTAASEEARTAAENIAGEQEGVVSVISDMQLESQDSTRWTLSQ